MVQETKRTLWSIEIDPDATGLEFYRIFEKTGVHKTIIACGVPLKKALLMAAAPELLGALEKAKIELDQYYETNPDDAGTREALLFANDALLKVRGHHDSR